MTSRNDRDRRKRKRRNSNLCHRCRSVTRVLESTLYPTSQTAYGKTRTQQDLWYDMDRTNERKEGDESIYDERWEVDAVIRAMQSRAGRGIERDWRVGRTSVSGSVPVVAGRTMPRLRFTDSTGHSALF